MTNHPNRSAKSAREEIIKFLARSREISSGLCSTKEIADAAGLTVERTRRCLNRLLENDDVVCVNGTGIKNAPIFWRIVD